MKKLIKIMMMLLSIGLVVDIQAMKRGRNESSAEETRNVRQMTTHTPTDVSRTAATPLPAGRDEKEEKEHDNVVDTKIVNSGSVRALDDEDEDLKKATELSRQEARDRDHVETLAFLASQASSHEGAGSSSSTSSSSSSSSSQDHSGAESSSSSSSSISSHSEPIKKEAEEKASKVILPAKDGVVECLAEFWSVSSIINHALTHKEKGLEATSSTTIVTTFFNKACELHGQYDRATLQIFINLITYIFKQRAENVFPRQIVNGIKNRLNHLKIDKTPLEHIFKIAGFLDIKELIIACAALYSELVGDVDLDEVKGPIADSHHFIWCERGLQLSSVRGWHDWKIMQLLNPEDVDSINLFNRFLEMLYQHGYLRTNLKLDRDDFKGVAKTGIGGTIFNKACDLIMACPDRMEIIFNLPPCLQQHVLQECLQNRYMSLGVDLYPLFMLFKQSAFFDRTYLENVIDKAREFSRSEDLQDEVVKMPQGHYNTLVQYIYYVSHARTPLNDSIPAKIFDILASVGVARTANISDMLSSPWLILTLQSIVLLSHVQPVEELFLEGNKLAVLPEDVCAIEFGVEGDFVGDGGGSLSLVHNELSSLPDSFGRLNIQSLTLSANRFTTIPEVITRMDGLQELFIAGNQITHLPEALLGMRLMTLDISDNPLIKNDDNTRILNTLHTRGVRIIGWAPEAATV